ncbi:hypothetical protein SEA_NANOSMITE_70 [Mycobacterium phage Nanosmite]|nr:hypothetical protein SEA_NANOSMITE_70 [Mycobacterium phage Nanosmite]
MKWLQPWTYRGRHRGEFPYHLPTGVCVNIKFYLHGSHVMMGQGVSHRPAAVQSRKREVEERALAQAYISIWPDFKPFPRTDASKPWCLYRE